MDLFEYQGKQYFARYGIPVSAGGVADTVDEAVAAADKAGYPVVVKAQVQVGGRGKAGGVKLATDADEVRFHAGNILGLDIKGHVVHRLWVEHASDIVQGVLRQLHPGPGGQEVPGHGVGQGRRGDRDGGRGGSRRHRPPAHRPVGRFRRGRRPRTGRRGRAGPRGPGRRRRHPVAPLPLLRRRRRRPGRDQPADPHPGRAGPRPRRQGDPGRQRRLSPSRVGRVPRHRRVRRAGAAGPFERACSTWAWTATSGSSPTGPAWP